MGGQRKLHNEKLHNFFSSPNIVRDIKQPRMRWAGHVAMSNAYKSLARKKLNEMQ
jgi:hypothetical protein